MISTLQNCLSANKNRPWQSIKRAIQGQQSPIFVHSLFFLFDDQDFITCTPQLHQIDSIIGKLTKKLPKLPLFTDRKYPFID